MLILLFLVSKHAKKEEDTQLLLSSDEEENSQEEEEEEEGETATQQETENDTESFETDADGAESDEGEEIVNTPIRPVIKKRKKQLVEAEETKKKRQKTSDKSETPKTSNVEIMEKKKKSEKRSPGTSGQSKKSLAANLKKKKGEVKEFTDANVDLNLHSDSQIVHPRKIKLTNNIILSCQMFDMETTKLNYDFPALVFQRKLKDSKAFEFNLPLSICPNLIHGVNYIMKENPKFFSKYSSE